MLLLLFGYIEERLTYERVLDLLRSLGVGNHRILLLRHELTDEVSRRHADIKIIGHGLGNTMDSEGYKNNRRKTV